MGDIADKPAIIPPEKVQEYELRAMAASRAGHDPLPGPLSGAFLDQEIKVLDVSVRPVVAFDMAMFKKLDSPLYRQMLEPENAASIQFTEEEGWEMCFQFTRPCREVRAALAKGREAFRESATQAFGDKYRPQDITKIVDAIAEQIKRVFSTAVAHETGDESEGGKTTFFTEAGDKTGLGGGSTTSAGS